ncbi:helix-turn-helix transcriptional regulator [Dechloromonas denitrificans]|uniref:helix-turn-helix transcriptional regulator n=1 Tax=Dechloromonas denitrificans TaxID=281362 RepID=UPI001CF90997|nr:helix-turn-helix domain-containing protein [Dechloromonas denitrificans]UCV06191.1 helix-turn-helix domain-containing protein [Dechloromonas denitrificans]
MSTSEISAILERQLLLQPGDRLTRLRKALGVGTVEMAARAGITRNTLRAVEAGDPAPSIGTYLRIMSVLVLGLSGELALLAGDTLQPPPAGSAAARARRAAPVVQVRVSTDNKNISFRTCKVWRSTKKLCGLPRPTRRWCSWPWMPPSVG